MNEICTCKNSGKPYELAGLMVISRDPGCKIHGKIHFAQVPPPIVEEPVLGDWKQKERVVK